VLVCNSIGCRRSDEATILVNQPPVVTLQPVDIVVNPGETAYLVTLGAGSPFPTFQWHKEGVAMPGFQHSTLTLYQVQESDEGLYFVTLKNDLGTVNSTIARISVNNPPVFTLQPAAQRVDPGREVTFSAAATGVPAPTFQWLFDGKPIDGATGSTLKVTALEAQQGTYSVTASNEAGSVRSAAAELTVNNPPAITREPRDIAKAYAGDRITLSVQVSGDPQPTLQWFQNGAPIPQATTDTLTLAPTNTTTVHVVATNSAGSAVSRTVTIVVDPLPSGAIPFGTPLDKVVDICGLLTGDCGVCLESSKTALGDCGYCIGGSKDGCIAGPRHLPNAGSICEAAGGMYILDKTNSSCTSVRGETTDPFVRDASTNAPTAGASVFMFVGAGVGAFVLIVVLLVVVLVVRQRKQRRESELKIKLIQEALLNAEVGGENPLYRDVSMRERLRGRLDPMYACVDDPVRRDPKFPAELNAQNIVVLDLIGEGAFAEVYKAELHDPESAADPTIVALKILKTGATPKDREDFLTEGFLMNQFHHKNILQLKGVVTAHGPTLIVTEFAEKGSLDNYLRDNQISMKTKVHFAKQIAEGMANLNGFVHRDLAARNILVMQDGTLKIGDFGLSRQLNLDKEEYVSTTGLIPVRWAAIEALNFRKFTAKSDVWSYGIVLYEIWTRASLPYGRKWSNMHVIEEVDKGFRLSPPPKCPRQVYQLMLDCWHPLPEFRPSFTEILERLDTLDLENPCFEYDAEAMQNIYKDGFASQADPSLMKGIRDHLAEIESEQDASKLTSPKPTWLTSFRRSIRRGLNRLSVASPFSPKSENGSPTQGKTIMEESFVYPSVLESAKKQGRDLEDQKETVSSPSRASSKRFPGTYILGRLCGGGGGGGGFQLLLFSFSPPLLLHLRFIFFLIVLTTHFLFLQSWILRSSPQAR
jgi:serine/threonine protein kinase